MDVIDPNLPETYRLSAIPIRERHYHSDDPYDLIGAVFDTAQNLEAYGCYLSWELPREVTLSCRVSNYEAEARNGGHEQFVSNSRWLPEIQTEVEQGLGAMGAYAMQELFREVARYINGDDAIRQAVKIRGGFDHEQAGKVDSWIRKKDGDFFALMKQTDFPSRHARWLRSLECIQPVPDLEWKFAIARAVQDHPLREARNKANGWRERDFIAEMRARAPLVKSLEDYAQDLGKHCKITLYRSPTRIWKTRVEDRTLTRFVFQRCRRNIFISSPFFLAEFDPSDDHFTLYRLKSAGQDNVVDIIGPAIGRISLERRED